MLIFLPKRKIMNFEEIEVSVAAFQPIFMIFEPTNLVHQPFLPLDNHLKASGLSLSSISRDHKIQIFQDFENHVPLPYFFNCPRTTKILAANKKIFGQGTT